MGYRLPSSRTEVPGHATVTNTHPESAREPDPRIRFEVETTIPTAHGSFRVRAYTDLEHGSEHLALIAGDPASQALPPLVRLHSECLTGEAFGSLKCECGPQLQAAMDAVALQGGVVLYLRGHEGRGIGLVNKLRAYRLQEQGWDTLDANLELGLPADARSYEGAAAILQDLGISAVRLLTNNPLKAQALTDFGITVAERVPLEVGFNTVNRDYLRTKAERMGHFLHVDEQDALPPSSGDASGLDG